ncbi:hypothetical protein CC78DRAFT_611738 [Lojkania enalia]|uniref:Mg2+ transporter protein n=1 Tax=Lojkania enalia TaxID=147567 RepID=A0A9P4NB94_9PLEO|nr:hypothetical protein CC78DRAFT_611738 [Didymosphaeria enalia]
MDLDPFDQWYSSLINVNAKDNVRLNEYEFFTLSHDARLDEPIEAKKILSDDIDGWIDGLVTKRGAGVDLLLMRHQLTGQPGLMNHWLPFWPDRFREIMQRLNLPKQYLHLRSTGGRQAGAATYYTFNDDNGHISRISFVIRPAHGSSTKFSSYWAFAMTWDVRTQRTIAVLDGISNTDIVDLQAYLKAASPLLSHPLAFPEVLLHMIMVHINERIRIPLEEEYYKEEQKTGVSHVYQINFDKHTTIWDWNFEDFQDATAKVTKFNTTISYITRRFNFASHLTKRFLSIMDALKTYEFADEAVMKMIDAADKSRRERLINRLALLENYEHYVQCMGKRVDNLVTVLYTVLSQIDSKNQVKIAEINLQIAQAVRHDSIPMRTIAYITLVLLPGAFISSIFGTNFFQYNPTTGILHTAPTFWHYWAITIPVTIFVLLVWNIWVYHEKLEGVSEPPGVDAAIAARIPHVRGRDVMQTLQELAMKVRRRGRMEGGGVEGSDGV